MIAGIECCEDVRRMVRIPCHRVEVDHAIELATSADPLVDGLAFLLLPVLNPQIVCQPGFSGLPERRNLGRHRVLARDRNKLHADIRYVGRNFVEASQDMIERLVNEAHEIPIHLLPGALGTIVDRASLLHGNPTAIIQHARAKDVPTPEQLAEMFNALPLAQATPVQEEEKFKPDPSALKQES